MIKTMIKRSTVGLAAVGMAAFGLGGVGLASAAPTTTTYEAKLSSLNGSGASGTAYVSVTGRKATVVINSTGNSANLPHAQHIHIGGNHVCPTTADDVNHDGLVDIAEGMPQYGDVQVSLTTKGDVSNASALALSRFPVASGSGSTTYSRTFRLPSGVSASDITQGVIVQHGISTLYNDPTMYDGSRQSADPDAPQGTPLEATIPADCGKLQPITTSASTSNPYVTLNNYNGHPGDTVVASGHSFGDNESVRLSLDGTTMTGFTDNNGNFTQSLTVPNETANNYQLTATGLSYNDTATANFYIAGYYPTAQPSSYYILPGQSLGFSGTNFAPHEMVRITDMSTGRNVTKVSTDGNGSFSTDAIQKIPYNAANSTISYQAKGLTSNTTSSFSVKIGTYYPELSPSSYYLNHSANFSASANGFAPNERVNFMINDQMVGHTSADGSGNVSANNLTAPNSGSSFTLEAMGALSNTTTSRDISLAQ